MSGFLGDPDLTPAAQQLFDQDLADDGYVSNVSRTWAYQPATLESLFALLGQTIATERLSFRQRGILVAACASTLGDSYCSLAWGQKLASVTDPGLAAAVLTGTDDGLTLSEGALAVWARKVARDPNGTTQADVSALRDAGFTDAQIFAVTAYVAVRIAFSTVNDALGARPDAELRTGVAGEVLDAVTWGREMDGPPRA